MKSESTKTSTLAEFQTVLSHGRYTIPDLDALKGVLSDAFALYDIAAGKGRVSELLAVIEKNADPEVFSLIIFALARFLRPRLQKAVAEFLELQHDHTATLADSFAPAPERRLNAIRAMKQRVRALWAEAGIADAAGMRAVEAEICRQIRGDPVAIAKIEAGDLGEVDRLFHECLRAPKGLIQ